MQGARAPKAHGQSLDAMGTLGRPWVILLTYVLTAMELSCLFLQFSIIPYLSRSLGLDSVAFGYQQTIFGVLQLLGGPLFGRFADQRGARAALTLSFMAASALYLLLAAACSPGLPGVALLFASRLPAVLMHTLPAAQMIITDLSAPEERPAALSRLGLCFGVGSIIGSLLGGTLSAAYGQLQGQRVRPEGHHPPAAAAWRPARVPGQGGLRLPLRSLHGHVLHHLHGLLPAGGRPVRLPHVLLRGSPDGHPGPGHRAVEPPLLGGRAAPGQRAGLHGGGAGHGADVQHLPLLPADARPGLQPVCPQCGHRQHADQGCLGLRHGDHAGPLRLCAPTDSDPGAHPGRPPVPQLRRPYLWPRAVHCQLPCPPFPLEAAYASEDGQSPVTTAPGAQTGNKLIWDLFRPDFCRLPRGARLHLVRQGAWR
uniref:Solute carrier family 22 member 18 n=1 Tax=Equus caballus TaxID=9796 RepID=F6S1P3_HORSE